MAKAKTKAQWLKKIKEFGQYGLPIHPDTITDKDWDRLQALRKEGKIYLLEDDPNWRAVVSGPRFGAANPIYQLRVTASTKAKAKAKARKFGRVMDIQHRGGDQYAVKVDQPRMGNPALPEATISSGWGGPPIKLTTDKEIREHLQELREELREDRAEFRHALPRMRQRAAKMSLDERMMEYGDYVVGSFEMGKIEAKEAEIQHLQDVLKQRQAVRKAEREAKKPPKTPVMRRRAGVVSRINPKSSKRVKSVRSLVREALK